MHLLGFEPFYHPNFLTKLVRCVILLSTSDELVLKNNASSGMDSNDQSVSDRSKEGEDTPLADWRDIRNLKLLNLVYDLTPTEYISAIITEVGMIPPTSVPVIIREMDSRQQMGR